MFLYILYIYCACEHVSRAQHHNKFLCIQYIVYLVIFYIMFFFTTFLIIYINGAILFILYQLNSCIKGLMLKSIKTQNKHKETNITNCLFQQTKVPLQFEKHKVTLCHPVHAGIVPLILFRPSRHGSQALVKHR